MKNLARALVYTGEKNEAKALLEELWKRANRRAAIVSTHFFSLGEAIALHNMRKEGGDDEGASEIIAGINAEIQRARAAGISVTRRGASLDFAEGLCQYLSGDEEPGLANIRRAVEEGYYINLAAPFYRELSKDPRFKPILRIQDATRERELQVLLQSVCRENPYADVWQPSTQTCTGQKAETRPRYGTG
jgi:hypothetical protein